MQNRSKGFLRQSVLSFLVLMLVSLLAHSASAADPASQRWNGLYGGVNVGYGWGNGDARLSPLPSAEVFIDLKPQTLSPDPNGVIGGFQLGYNIQKDSIVYGIETDFQISDMKGTKKVSPIITNDGTPWEASGSIKVRQSTDWFGTLRLRAGVTATPSLLLYVTGGLAYGHVKYSANTDFSPSGITPAVTQYYSFAQYPASASKTDIGWAVGGGAEYAINNKWSIKAEYLYYDLGSKTLTAKQISSSYYPGGTGYDSAPDYRIRYKWDASAGTVKIGLNYRF